MILQLFAVPPAATSIIILRTKSALSVTQLMTPITMFLASPFHVRWPITALLLFAEQFVMISFMTVCVLITRIGVGL